MTVVDASALLTIYLDENGAEAFRAVFATEKILLPSAAVAESAMKLIDAGLPPEDCRKWFEELTARGAGIVDLTGEMALAAITARARFSKSRRPAKLNFGDCLVYAAASVLKTSLLFKGSDFGKTDLAIHPASVMLP